jgi:hypothetical protein
MKRLAECWMQQWLHLWTDAGTPTRRRRRFDRGCCVVSSCEIFASFCACARHLGRWAGQMLRCARGARPQWLASLSSDCDDTGSTERGFILIEAQRGPPESLLPFIFTRQELRGPHRSESRRRPNRYPLLLFGCVFDAVLGTQPHWPCALL